MMREYAIVAPTSPAPTMAMEEVSLGSDMIVLVSAEVKQRLEYPKLFHCFVFNTS